MVTRPFALALFLTALLVTPLWASPITAIHSANPSGSLNPGPTPGFHFGVGGTSSLIDGTNGIVAGGVPTSFSGPFVFSGQNGTYSVGDVSATLSFPGATGGGNGTATFTLTGLSAIVNNNGGAAASLTIAGFQSLLSTTGTTFDFSQFGPGSMFSLSLPRPNFDFISFFANGGQSLLQSNSVTHVGVPPLPTPEPASVLIWGSLVATVWFLGRRKRS